MQYVLGLLAAVLIAVFAIFHVEQEGRSASKSSSVSDAVAQVNDFSGKIMTDFQGNFSEVTSSVVVSDSLVPSAYTVSGTTIENGWGGSVVPSVDATNAAELDIAESGVPAADCEAYATGVATAAAVTINGTALTAPIDPAAATTACKNEVSEVTFVFSPAN